MFFSLLRCRLVLLHCFSASSRLLLLHCFSASALSWDFVLHCPALGSSIWNVVGPSQLLIESLRLCCTLPLCLWDSFLINLRHEERHQMLLAGTWNCSTEVWVGIITEISFFLRHLHSKHYSLHGILHHVRRMFFHIIHYHLICFSLVFWQHNLNFERYSIYDRVV